ncbi:MAG TPA: serine hydrolase domain-containing protein [Saprospiraceae bacterium]|nr:serine hydrolase domain-containing protein [Saprospiraceae bacterium]
MRFSTLFLFLFVSCIFLLACGQKSFKPADSQLVTQDGFPSAMTDTLAKYLATMPNGTQVACVRITDSLPYFYGVLRESDQLKTTANPAAIFEIGSISKVMTATLLARAVQRGTVELDEPIDPYLPYTLKGELPITFQQLANHTSGLPRVPGDMAQDIIFNRNNPYKDYDTSRLRKFLSEKLELEQDPGEDFAYSNLGAGLLGQTLAYITGKSYEQQLQEIIFQPYGMEQSTTDRTKVDAALVQGLNANGKPTANWDLPALAGAGAVLSSADDLASFVLAHFNPQDSLLSRTREMTYQRGEMGGVGLGWFIRREGERSLYWHNGGTGGYKAFLMMDPISQDAVIVLSNCSAFSDQSPKIDALGQALLPPLNN